MEQEDKKTAASYIYTFYETIRVLTAYHAQYANVILEIKGKTDKDIASPTELSQEDYKVVIFCMQQVRGQAISAWIQLKALEHTAKIKLPSDIQAQYDAVYDARIINAKECENFVISMNTILVENVMQSLLQTSMDITNKIYYQNGPSAP